MDTDELWRTDEYGKSHEGRVGVLDADGSVPGAVYVDSNSGSSGWEVRHWSVYDGEGPYTPRPRADVLRAECSCGWAGQAHRIDWAAAGRRPFREHGQESAGRCLEDWDTHIEAVGDSTIPLPAELSALLSSVGTAIEKLGEDSPAAALKAARALELIAQRTAHWPAHDARGQDPAVVAAALGLNVADTRRLLARYGGWSYYG